MLRPRAMLAISRKDMLDVLLNKTTLSALTAPIFLAILFLVIGKVVGNSTVTTLLVYNPGQSGLQQVISQTFHPVQVTNANASADVSAAFAANESHRDTTYDVGLIIPLHFEQEIQAGGHPQVSLYLNANSISIEQSTLLQAAIANYARSIRQPQLPIDLVTTTINPTTQLNTNVGAFISIIYTGSSLMLSFIVSLTLLPGLLIEENERKTFRILLVAPASFQDIILSKALTTFCYQLVISLLVLTIQGGWIGNIFQTLCFITLGTCFSMALGLLISSKIQTLSAAGAICGIGSFMYTVPSIFVGPLGQLFGKASPFLQVLKILPTYYLADGIFNALQNQGSLEDSLLDSGIVLASSIIVLVLALWQWNHRTAALASTW